jgi:hypothetical protein
MIERLIYKDKLTLDYVKERLKVHKYEERFPMESRHLKMQ